MIKFPTYNRTIVSIRGAMVRDSAGEFFVIKEMFEKGMNCRIMSQKQKAEAQTASVVNILHQLNIINVNSPSSFFSGPTK